eukprot:786448-Prorocentrum_minimum.AAC.1
MARHVGMLRALVWTLRAIVRTLRATVWTSRAAYVSSSMASVTYVQVMAGKRSVGLDTDIRRP